MRLSNSTQSDEAFETIRRAALDRTPVSGLTHQFYRYPARFSPVFARACIEVFSRPGEVILDPYMGGGTTTVEAMAAGRRAIGSDINSLAIFVASTKVSRLSDEERVAIKVWANDFVPTLRCTRFLDPHDPELQHRPRNMTIAAVRWHRKLIAVCLDSIEACLNTVQSKQFARCVVLNVGQWALNGRKRIPTATEFRARVSDTCDDMIDGSEELEFRLEAEKTPIHTPVIRQNDAEEIDQDEVLRKVAPVDLVVTSPPYPGIHMLYHRWQVDGRKETDAPYWIANCNDGDGATHYNFADRRPQAEDRYFEKACDAFSAVRRVMRDGAILVQMIAFSQPARQLRRYLSMMEQSGFTELREHGKHRIWRDVPSRRWHANLQGKTSSSKEVVLIHVAN